MGRWRDRGKERERRVMAMVKETGESGSEESQTGLGEGVSGEEGGGVAGGTIYGIFLVLVFLFVCFFSIRP